MLAIAQLTALLRGLETSYGKPGPNHDDGPDSLYPGGQLLVVFKPRKNRPPVANGHGERRNSKTVKGSNPARRGIAFHAGEAVMIPTVKV